MSEVMPFASAFIDHGVMLCRSCGSHDDEAITADDLPTDEWCSACDRDIVPVTVACAWFATCTNVATHEVRHPIMGWMPACDRCLTRVGIDH